MTGLGLEQPRRSGCCFGCMPVFSSMTSGKCTLSLKFDVLFGPLLSSVNDSSAGGNADARGVYAAVNDQSDAFGDKLNLAVDRLLR